MTDSIGNGKGGEMMGDDVSDGRNGGASMGESGGTFGDRAADAGMMGRRAFVRRLGAGLLLTFVGGASSAALTGCVDFGNAGIGKREYTDDAGRTVTIPTPGAMTNIYFTSGLAEIFCFTLNPEILGGTAIEFTNEDLKYLPANMGELVNMGTLSEDGIINREMLMANDIQVVFSISAVAISEANIADANELQNATKIPVVILDGSMDVISECYRKLGNLLGKEQRAEELGSYCEAVFDNVNNKLGDIPDDERVSLYYAEGPQGLQTEPSTSMHAVVFELARAYNVADIPDGTSVGMSNVSLEQVMAWDPEVIIAWSWDERGGADQRIKASEAWSDIRAVKDGRVYTMPDVPFSWLDRPPGVNRFLGVQWVANMLYPDKYDVDMVEVGREFYKLFYQVDVDPEVMKGFLGNSYPPYGKESK